MTSTVGELLEYVDLDEEDLRKMCTDEDLNELSLRIRNWEEYASLLRLHGSDTEDIKNKGKSESQKMLLALERWKQKLAFKATFEYLVKEIFLKKDNMEYAWIVCQQLKGMGIKHARSYFTFACGMEKIIP